MSAIQRCKSCRDRFIIAIVMRCVRYLNCWNALFDLRRYLCNALLQLFCILHINQQSHMIFTYLVRIVNQNERISMFQELLKSIHYRNNFETWKIAQLSNLCLRLLIWLFAMLAMRWCDFHHNSMRTRSIFDIIDYLNNVHFVFQNKFSIVCFTYWVQMLLRCEIDEIAKRMQNHWNFDFDAKISQSYQIWF